MPTDPSITQWRSIITLVVFVLSNLIVLFPFHVPIYIYRPFFNAFLRCLVSLRVIPPPQEALHQECGDKHLKPKSFVRLNFPANLNTGPLIGVLFLLSTTAIGRTEVKKGTLGANNISPIDLVAFALTLGYVSSSIDAAGLIRYLTFKVLRVFGKSGHRLFIVLYFSFFAMGCFFGNDPVIHMGMLFLAYMNRISANIVHPRAWLHTQFAIANIASAIFVSSNTTNVVIAQAFQIGFAEYTANLIVPVMASVVILAPLLLYIIFANEQLIPFRIQIHELPEEIKMRKPISPNIPFGYLEDMLTEDQAASDEPKTLRLDDVMNPFLDKASAAFGVFIMTATLVVLLSLTAANFNNVPVFWATLPASFVMLCWDTFFGWYHRCETREISRRGRQEIEWARLERMQRAIGEETIRTSGPDTLESIETQSKQSLETQSSRGRNAFSVSRVDLTTLGLSRLLLRRGLDPSSSSPRVSVHGEELPSDPQAEDGNELTIYVSDQFIAFIPVSPATESNQAVQSPAADVEIPGTFSGGSPTHKRTGTAPVLNSENEGRDSGEDEVQGNTLAIAIRTQTSETAKGKANQQTTDEITSTLDEESREEEETNPEEAARSSPANRARPTLISLLEDVKTWSQQTFPNVSAVLARLPFSLVLFAFPTFILVQSLVSSGWVTVFAHGWNSWVEKTGTVGAVGGMGFLSVVLSNFAGTNIGATVLLSRVLQIWADLHVSSETPISERTYWGAVYTLAIGVNYGAFSLTFGASLAGLMWRDDLAQKHIHVRRLEFARVNLPLITISMATSCAVLVGQVYIVRHTTPYTIRS
ncbi:hypothetical protein AK830_g10678 [Neonectria ditissima]|uniref:Citrate transporter-like domain-containing protein n=1 Tax=Neonectria ditissima TaxID=78410 RepID=A0A0N8H5D7_9HYPO|nr:hypothetical protein AK830_g10678 [Neonectria ditissima]